MPPRSTRKPDKPAMNSQGVVLTPLYPVLAPVAAYLLGSLSFAVIVTRLMGLSDPRTYGSKNPGATNVLRSGSKVAAVVTLLLDALKGWLPVVLVLEFGRPHGLEDGCVASVGRGGFVGGIGGVCVGVVLALCGRQGRGHGAGRAGRHQRLVGAGHGRGLARRGPGFALFVAGLAGGCGVCAGLLPADGRRGTVGGGDGGDGAAAGLAAQGQYPAADRGQGGAPGGAQSRSVTRPVIRRHRPALHTSPGAPWCGGRVPGSRQSVPARTVCGVFRSRSGTGWAGNTGCRCVRAGWPPADGWACRCGAARGPYRRCPA